MWSLFVCAALAASPASPSTPDTVDEGRKVLAWALGGQWMSQSGDLVTPEVLHQLDESLAGAEVQASLHLPEGALRWTVEGELQSRLAGSARTRVKAPVVDAQVGMAAHLDDAGLATQVQGRMDDQLAQVLDLGQPFEVAADLPLGELTSSVSLSLEHRQDAWVLTARTYTAPAGELPTGPRALSVAATFDGNPVQVTAAAGAPVGRVTRWAVRRLAVLTQKLIPTLIVG